MGVASFKAYIPRERPIRTALLAAILIVALSPASAQTPTALSETAAVERQIAANNEAIALAIRARDYAVLEQLWSPNMIVNSPANDIRTRVQVIASMRQGGLHYASLKGTVESFSVFGDIAVEMGHEDFAMAGGPAAGKQLQRRYTDIWQRTGDHWVQIARQATILNADADWVYGKPSAASPPQSH